MRNYLAILLWASFALGEPPKGFDAAADVPHGKVTEASYTSTSLKFDRPLVIYTPPNCSAEKKYPVLYLLHGSGDNEKGWIEKGAAAAILDNLYADPKSRLEPMIVVMPLGFARKVGAAPPADKDERAKQSKSQFDEDFVKDLIPWVDAHYPTLADREHRAIAGLSMGGHQSLRIGLTHLDLFAWVACFSSLVREPYEPGVGEALADPKTLNEKLKLLYISSGDKDNGLAIFKGMIELMTEKKITHRWELKQGGHEWKVWKESLWEVAPLLFK